MTENREITFEIVEHIGVLQEYPTGWMKEVNLVSWNGNPAKVDIRDWDPSHERMSKGITLSLEEAHKLRSHLNARNIMAPTKNDFDR